MQMTLFSEHKRVADSFAARFEAGEEVYFAAKNLVLIEWNGVKEFNARACTLFHAAQDDQKNGLRLVREAHICSAEGRVMTGYLEFPFVGSTCEIFRCGTCNGRDIIRNAMSWWCNTCNDVAEVKAQVRLRGRIMLGPDDTSLDVIVQGDMLSNLTGKKFELKMTLIKMHTLCNDADVAVIDV